jgi:hypothetical protein
VTTDRPDLGAVYDARMKQEFVDCDLDTTMATMVEEPYTYFAPKTSRRSRPHRCLQLLPGPLRWQGPLAC